MPFVVVFLFNASPKSFRAGVAFNSCLFCCIEMFVFDYLMYFSFDVIECRIMFISPIEFFVFFNSGRSDSESLARFGINLVRWCTLPRNDRNCFSVLGLSSFVMASVFVMSGVIPLGVIVKPTHSMFFCEFAFL